MSRTQQHNHRPAAAAKPANAEPVEVTAPAAPVVNAEPATPEPVITTDGTATGTTVATPTKQQLLDAARKVARDAKRAAKEKQKAENAAKRADGVIGTIKQALQLPNGTTRGEVLDTLVQKFPTRDRDGMAVTVGIQFSRLAKSTGVPVENYKVEGRGRVYGFRTTLVRPAVVAVGTPAATTPEAPAPTE